MTECFNIRSNTKPFTDSNYNHSCSYTAVTTNANNAKTVSARTIGITTAAAVSGALVTAAMLV